MGSRADVCQNSQDMGHLQAKVINNGNYISCYFIFSQVQTMCCSVLEIQSETSCMALGSYVHQF